jgi:RHS repeat-associated protein
MVYDALGNVVFSQDGVQRSKNEWSYQLYDGQQRPTVSGRFTYSATPEPVCKILSEYTGEGTLCGYTTTLDFGKYSGVIVDKVLYYDSYDFIRIMTDYEKSVLMYVNAEQPYTEAFKVDGSFKVSGMQTGAISYVLGDTVRSVSAAYYDIRGRKVQTRSTNFKGGAETVLTAYTFTGKELYKKIATNVNGEELITQQYEYHYDHAERPTETYLTVNGGAKQMLTKMCYDEVGRLASRTHGNNVTERYDYNIRSWLTDINSTAFKEHLRYEQSGETPGCYGGNIASMIWKVNAGAYSSQGAFHNSYDKLSRLCAVKYQDSNTKYSKFVNYSYDALGNILGLQRQGVLDDGSIGDIDNLTYSYDGNQLVKVDDSADAPTYSGAMHFIDDADEDEEYRYDANGNMTADLNNYIVSVSYNSLNLPSNIIYANGSHIDYTYSSTGEKVCTDYYNRVKVNIVRPTITATTGRYLTYYKHTNTEYCGNHIFENGELKMTLFAGGYVTYSNGEPEYHFYVRDHQGNNRLVMNEAGIVEQVNDYTPFGVQMKNSFAETSDQRYKYNGKELDRMLGLDLYDYGARFYDARIARWQTIDPLCEKYYSISPYAYCANNPILFIDPDGKEPSEAEAARMSAYVYGDIAVKLTGSWTVSHKNIRNFNPVDDKNGSGFKSMLFERTVDGKTEYAYALAGTDKSSKSDWNNNALQLIGQSEQYKMALENADALLSGLNGSELTFVGHSLGGGMAAACAYSKGGRALTFNPAGVSPFTILPTGRARIDTYITYRDELNIVQNLFKLLPRADGKVHVRVGDAKRMGHSIENFYEPSVYKRIYDTIKDKTINFLRSAENALTNKWPF